MKFYIISYSIAPCTTAMMVYSAETQSCDVDIINCRVVQRKITQSLMHCNFMTVSHIVTRPKVFRNYYLLTQRRENFEQHC